MEVYKLIEKLLSSKRSIDRQSAELITDAEKFRLVNSADYTPDILNGAEQFTRQLFAHDIFPLPYDLCLFELVNFKDAAVADDIVVWILAYKEIVSGRRNEWAVFFEVYMKFGDRLGPVGALGQIYTDKYSEDDNGEHGWFEVIGIDKKLMTGAEWAKANPEQYLRKLQNKSLPELEPYIRKHYNEVINNGPEAGIMQLMGRAFGQLLFTLGLLSTNGIVVENKSASHKFVNAKRIKAGKPPLDFEHKVVSIDPLLLKIPGAKLGGTHASPRLHMRRGHIRRIAEGRRISVRPHLVGTFDRGVITHEYLVHSDSEPD